MFFFFLPTCLSYLHEHKPLSTQCQRKRQRRLWRLAAKPLCLFDNGCSAVVPYFTPHQREHFRGKKQAFTTLEQKRPKEKKARADGAVFAFVQTVLFSTIHKPPLWAQVSQMYLEHAAGAEAAFCWSVAEVLIPRCLCTCISISFFFFYLSYLWGRKRRNGSRFWRRPLSREPINCIYFSWVRIK